MKAKLKTVQAFENFKLFPNEGFSSENRQVSRAIDDQIKSKGKPPNTVLV